jgi:drug/metabolite transporter (DMT)-like permease
MQMLAGGTLLTVAGIVTGEPARVALDAVSLRSVVALGYLIVFGSLIAFSAYVWLLRVSTAARVSTYAYVNPAVALILGWSLAGEPVSARMLAGSFVVLTAVMLVTFRGGVRKPARRPNPPLARGVRAST